jgi:hypothetical protein
LKHDIGGARVSHEVCQALVDGRFEHEVSVGIGLQPDLTVEARRLFLAVGRPVRHGLGEAQQPVWTDDRAQVVEKVDDGNDAEGEGAPLHGLEQHMFGGRTKTASLRNRPFSAGFQPRRVRKSPENS